MKTLEELLQDIDAYFQEANSDTAERLKRIEQIGGFTQYSKRLTQLSDDEKADFINCMEGYPLTHEQKALLDTPDEKTKKYYVDMWARSTYFRRCAWEDYLQSKTSEKPTMSVIATAA